MRKSALVFFFTLSVSLAWTEVGQDEARQMAEGARQFLASLSPELAARARYPMEDEERMNWHFIPRTRKGVPFKELSPAQRKLAHGLLAAALSSEGLVKANNIMYLDQILYERQNRNPIRDPDAYFFTFFGIPPEPGQSADWGWRLEGHHISLNFTLRKGRVVSTSPAFFGANPARVPDGPHAGLRTLAEEEDLGRSFLESLTAEQRTKALIAEEAPADIVTGATRRADLGPARGLAVAEMTPGQAAALLSLLRQYANRLRGGLAEAELARVKHAGLEKIHFVWAGGAAAGQPHYYRIHGPTFAVEYDNTQDNANHVHTVWRDFERDFGADPLAEHYARSEHHRQKDNRQAATARAGR
jgi:hypothetical protein